MGNSGATEKKPKYHGSLSDGVTEVPLMFVNAGGKDNPLAIRRSAYPRTSTRIAQGDTRYGDFELPYKPIEQSNWTGGRGSDDFEKDTARYLDGGSVNPEHENQVILGGQPTYGTGYRSQTMALPGNITWQGLYNTQLYISRPFTPSANYTTTFCDLWIRKVGSPSGALTVAIYADSGGSPSTLHVASAPLAAASVTDVLSAFTRFTWTAPSALVGSTQYHLVVYGAGSPTATDCWQVGVDNTATGKKSAAGSSWSATTYGPYYRVPDNVSTWRGKLFEYKRGTYFLTQPADGSASKILMNGDRGVTDTNAGALTRLNDATKSWTTNEWAGCWVLLSSTVVPLTEEQRWRLIVDNGSNYLTVSPAWDTTQYDNVEYIILGSNKWKTVGTMIAYATDVVVAGDAIIVAFGEGGNYVRLIREYNLDNVWTYDGGNPQTFKANILQTTRTPTGIIVWGASDKDYRFGACISKAFLPHLPNDVCRNGSGSFYLHTPIGTVASADEPWLEYPGAYGSIVDSEAIRMSIVNGVTGLVATRAISPPVDIARAEYLVVPIKSDIDVPSAGDLKFRWDSTKYCGKSTIATMLQQLSKGETPVMVRTRDNAPPSSVWSFDNSATDKWFELDNSNDDTPGYVNPIYLEAADDKLYIGCDTRFGKIVVDVFVANTTGVTMAAECWDGIAWVALTITDGTASGGATLAVDGNITFTIPVEWSRGCDADSAKYIDTSLYWVRLKTAGAGTTNGKVAEFSIATQDLSRSPSEARRYQALNLIGENSNDESGFTLLSAGRLFIGFSKQGTGVYFDLHTANNNAATMAAYYWNGRNWTSVTITDGTASGGATLAQDGLISWTTPVLWEPGTDVPEGQYLDQDLYWICMIPSADLDPVAVVSAYAFGADIEASIDLPKSHDGDTSTAEYMTLRNADRLVVMAQEQFTGVVVDLGTTVNAVTASMAAQYWNGYAWAALTIVTDGTLASSKTLAQDGTISFKAPTDWEPIVLGEYSGYAVRLYPSADLTPHVIIKELYVAVQTTTEKSLPALVAGRWAYVDLSIIYSDIVMSPEDHLRNITSIGLVRSTNLGTQVVDIGKIEAIVPHPVYVPVGDASDPITGMERYGDTETLWVIKTASVWEMQETGPVSIPLRELSGMRSSQSGRAHTVNDVYFYFGLDQHIERYHAQSLDDVGPDRDSGLPADRQGYPWYMESQPGHVLLAINAGGTGFSSILSRRGGGWHEVYRAPLGDMVHSMVLQVTEGSVNRLWMAVGNDLVWIPVTRKSANPLYDSNYRYIHEGYLVTGWISVGFLDIVKMWKSVKLFTENLSATKTIRVQYQLETGSLGTGWTDIVSVHTASPFQEINLNAAYTVVGRRIRFRLVFSTNDNSVTPVLKAFVLETLLRFPVKYQYSCTVRLADQNAYVDDIVDRDVRAETHFTTIENWANYPTALTFRCSYSPYDNKLVVVEPPGARPVYVDTANQVEQHVVEIILLEI